MYEEKTQNLSVSFSRSCPFRFRGYTYCACFEIFFPTFRQKFPTFSQNSTSFMGRQSSAIFRISSTCVGVHNWYLVLRVKVDKYPGNVTMRHCKI